MGKFFNILICLFFTHPVLFAQWQEDCPDSRLRSGLQELISGSAKSLDTPVNYARTLITHSQQGEWAFKADLSGGKDYVQQSSACGKAVKSSSYSEIVRIYTTMRNPGFYSGEFRVNGTSYSDTEKPVINKAILSGNRIQIFFSEAVVPVPEAYNNCFSLPDDVFTLNDVTWNDDYTVATLLYAADFKCGTRYRLGVKNISDSQGNTLSDTILHISTPCIAAPYDIAINEIMANPSPSVRLPEYEYIELYNRSSKNIELKDWVISYGNTAKIFPSYLFPANSYLLLVHPEAEPDMAGYGATVPLLGSLTSISNSGQYLQLKDPSGTVISWIDFTTDWYDDNLKTDGGWSLEQIDPEQPCVLKSNWKASISRTGGTPGMQNSVNGRIDDDEIPEILWVGVEDENTVILYMSKPAGNPLPSVSGFAWNPARSVRDIQINGKHYDRLALTLHTPLLSGEWYDLTVNGKIFDCAGYEARGSSFHFSMPQDIDSTDVVINEILFHPEAGGYPFIELYNRASGPFKVSDLMISLRNTGGQLSNPVSLTDDPFLLLPGRYLVISRNTDAIIRRYGTDNRAAFLTVPNLPSPGRESGQIVLLDKSFRIIDEVHYDSKLHSDFLKSGAGVSLERLHPDRSSFDTGNWHTASQTCGFGTPGKQNSQYIEVPEAGSEVTLKPEVFSPDNDGYEDILTILYSFDTPSLMADVIIFDSAGRKIRHLVLKQLLAANGDIIWDGADDSGRKCLTGIYIVYFSAYNSGGIHKKFRIPCVLAGKR
jgi:hypothetical protein